jgi:uncharacterized protein
MKIPKLSLGIAIWAAVFWGLSVCVAAGLEVPQLKSRVTDLAGLLAPDQVQSLEAKLADLERTDSTQIAILIIPSLEGEPLEDYSIRVAEAWRLGQKGRDNGALLIVAMKERRVRIEVGYGLEPTLTDAKTSQIIRNEIIPQFRTGDFYGGIDAGTTAMTQVVRGGYQGTPEPRRNRSGRSTANRLDWIILMLFPVLPILSWTGKWGGTVLGAGAGALLPYFLFGGGLGPLLVGAVLGGTAGAFLGGLIQAGSRSQHRPRSSGGPFWPGGGFGRGFGGGGYGGGGGGFSGGGGGFGGGGSSGSW